MITSLNALTTNTVHILIKLITEIERRKIPQIFLIITNYKKITNPNYKLCIYIFKFLSSGNVWSINVNDTTAKSKENEIDRLNISESLTQFRSPLNPHTIANLYGNSKLNATQDRHSLSLSFYLSKSHHAPTWSTLNLHPLRGCQTQHPRPLSLLPKSFAHGIDFHVKNLLVTVLSRPAFHPIQ